MFVRWKIIFLRNLGLDYFSYSHSSFSISLTTLSFPLSCRILYLLLLNVWISKKGVGDEWTTLSFTFLTISNKTFHLQFENYKGSFSFQSHLKLIWMFTDYLFHLFLWRNSFERLCEQKASCISLVGENTHINSQFNPLRKSPRLVFSLALNQYFEMVTISFQSW